MKQNGKKNNKTTLSRKSINALADELESRRQQNGKPSKTGNESTNNSERPRKKLFFWGALSGVAAAAALPMLGKQARPAVRVLVKGGIKAGRYVQQVASSVKEEVEDIAAEAKSDLDTETTS
ncbi:MAG: hypothetical protein JWO80_5516 [Bryobacterales bacterium]|nr:hypothetical protein [Bryobacterales bacterium]